jgi:hypothetical protein
VTYRNGDWLLAEGATGDLEVVPCRLPSPRTSRRLGMVDRDHLRLERRVLLSCAHSFRLVSRFGSSLKRLSRGSSAEVQYPDQVRPDRSLT